MNRIKVIYGVLSILLGYIVFILMIDLASKPTNIGISLKPLESLEIYFFGFVWIMGNIGWIIGSLLLTVFLALFYFLGVWIYKRRNTRVKQ